MKTVPNDNMNSLNTTNAIKLREGTTVDDMLDIIADEIISGDIAPGTKLDGRAIAERFEVSRTPVREMFGYLAALGLVEKRPNRGVTVATISDELLMTMYEAMSELEAACARLCALRMTQQERHTLKLAHQEALHLVRDGTSSDYEAFNHDFHTLLYEGCHSPYLRDLAIATRTRLKPFRKVQFRMPQRPSLSWQEHDAIVTAIMEGDSEGAAKATRSHVMQVSISTQHYMDEHRG